MTEGELALLEQLWSGAMRIEQIADTMGYSRRTIVEVTKRNRERFPLRRRNFTKEERNHWADRVLSGEIGTFEAARMAGVTPQTICKWKRERK